MKQGKYKVLEITEEAQEFCDINNIKVNDEVYIYKLDDTDRCSICGRATKWILDTGYSNPIGSECIKKIKMKLIEQW